MQNEFGQPARDVAQDANEGILYPPSQIQTAATGQGLERVKDTTQLDTAVKSFGDNFGTVLEQFKIDEHKMLQEERALDAVSRQGLDRTINEVDKEAERTGWTKAFAGQSVQYREAQKLAITNTIMDEELNESTYMWKNANLTPEMYLQRSKDSLKDKLAPFEDDPDARREFAIQAIASKTRLQQQHYKEHYAYTQQQFYNQAEELFTKGADLLNVQKSQATTAEDIQKVEEGYAALTSKAYKPANMEPAAWRKAQNNAVLRNLRQGNSGLYRYMNKNGMFDDLNEAEKKDFDAAVKVLDNYVNDDYQKTVHEHGAITDNMTDIQAQWRSYDAHVEQLNQIFAQKGSGTLNDKENYQNAIDDLKRLKPEAEKKVSANQIRRGAINNLADLLNPNPYISAQNENSIVGKDKDGFPIYADNSMMQEAVDLKMRQLYGGTIGKNKEESQFIDGQELLDAYIKNPNLFMEASQYVTGKDKNYIPTVFKSLGTNFVKGYDRMVDANGQPDPDFKAMAASLEQLHDKHPEYVAEMMGDANYAQFLNVLDAVKSNQSVDIFKKNQDLIRQNEKSGQEAAWPVLKDGQSKAEYLSTKLNVTDPQMLSIGTRYYNEGLKATGYDHTKAAQYAKAKLKNEVIQVYKIPIEGGKWLNEIDQDMDFNTMLKVISDPKSGLARNIIDQIVPSTTAEENRNDFSKVPGLTIRTIGFGKEAKVVIGSTGGNEIPLDRETLKVLFNEANVTNKLIKKERAAYLLSSEYTKKLATEHGRKH